jgi:hypothetical protein
LPPSPGGRGLEVEIWKAAPTVIDRAAVVVCAVGDVLSVALRVKLLVPAEDGVPEMVLPVKVNPAGREPEEIDHM